MSRPGFARTPLTSGNANATDQADLCAALMSELGIEQYSVQGGSGGGPVALQMAIRHPNNVKVLLLNCAITGDYIHKDDV